MFSAAQSKQWADGSLVMGHGSWSTHYRFKKFRILASYLSFVIVANRTLCADSMLVTSFTALQNTENSMFTQTLHALAILGLLDW